MPPQLASKLAHSFHGYGKDAGALRRPSDTRLPLTVESPAKPTGAVALSVCDSRVHSAPAPASALTYPDSLGLAGCVLVPFDVAALFDWAQYSTF